MSARTDWWKDALEYVGPDGVTPSNLAEMLEAQVRLQLLSGERGDVHVPLEAVELIVAALKRASGSRTSSRRSWQENKLYDIIILKAKREVQKLIDGGEKSSVAYGIVAKTLKAKDSRGHYRLPQMKNLSVKTIERDLQRADDGKPFRR